jgi:hypothetical protein
MAFEITTTAANDTVNTEAITQAFMDYARDVAVATPLFRYWPDLIVQKTNKLQVPNLSGAVPTADDNGAWGDTEYDATEGTALSNAALTTGSVTVTVGEYGIMHTVTDNIGEDSAIAGAFMAQMAMNAARIIQSAIEVDACALFAGLSNSVGSTGVNITIAQAVSMLDGIRNRGFHPGDGIAFVWDNQTWGDLRDLLIATSTSMAVYASTADRLLGVSPTQDNGLLTGLVGSFLGQPSWVTGQTPTANSAADVVSAAFCATSPSNDPVATFGFADKRPLRLETQRYPEGRGEKFVWSRRCGVFESLDGSGTKAVTDA